MCKWALISWPIDQQTPHQLYLIIGELYDKNIKENISTLSKFNRDLQYLYPFRFSQEENSCYNEEDIYCLQKKYGLTSKLRLVGESKNKIITFRSPVLYDISCMVPLFEKSTSTNKIIYEQKNDVICIVIPYLNPVNRGKLLEDVLKYGPGTFVLVGDTYGKNKDSTATLMSRYLLSCQVPSDRIIKIRDDKIPECILESIEIINMTSPDPDYELLIACRHKNIQEINKTIRIWKNQGVIEDLKITYMCPY
jgi:hypothetical protein